MLRFEGSKDLPQTPAEVWNKLSDARFLVQCVPGMESVARAERTSAVCTLRPGFAFVRGTLELSLQVVDAVPDTSARLLLQTKGIGTTSEVEARWSVQPQGSGSRLTWSVEIKSLGGLLKAVPQGLIKATAQKVIDDALATVAAKVAAKPETS